MENREERDASITVTDSSEQSDQFREYIDHISLVQDKAMRADLMAILQTVTASAPTTSMKLSKIMAQTTEIIKAEATLADCRCTHKRVKSRTRLDRRASKQQATKIEYLKKEFEVLRNKLSLVLQIRNLPIGFKSRTLKRYANGKGLCMKDFERRVTQPVGIGFKSPKDALRAVLFADKCLYRSICS